MFTRKIRIVCLAALCMSVSLVGDNAAQEKKPIPNIETFTKGMKKHPGFVPYYWDETTGKIWLEIDRWANEFLYVHSLPFGLGSNDIGLDRGQWGASRVVRFHRAGPKVLLVQPNYDFRAQTNDADEKQAVRESFAQSILWGFKIAAADGERVLVDATDFFLSDAHDVSVRLKNKKQGNYKLDASRSAIFMPRSKNFPNNTDIEAVLTFTGKAEGAYIKSVTPTPNAVTVHEHHSFIHLPDDGFQPRRFHPQCGYFHLSFKDYAAPLGAPLEQRFIRRHRLRKKNPRAKVSEVVKPIIYYLDRGAPEPVRSALLDGARWWSKAFEEAGFKDAYRVKMLPPGVDPMDVRYNVIQWVHRSTRGWSYGSSIYDPRTGEIIRGHVTLGSLRVRQDMLIAEGLLAPFTDGKIVSPGAREMALARLRQLSAHEVGHTLGLAHNFAASTTGDASVMDYPHPKIKIIAGNKLDVSNAYGVGVGEWDKVAIRYGYSHFPRGAKEDDELAKILHNARKRGLVFVSDQDARPAGGAHPTAHLWDNGKNALNEMQHVLKVRAVALKNFGEHNLAPGRPLAALEERLAPIYLLHRYQVEAVAKILGGVDYRYTTRGEDETPPSNIEPAQQRRALQLLLRTIEPEALAVPESLLKLIPPRPLGYGRHRELFNKRTGPTFDAIAAAEAAADHTIGMMLHPQRCARLVEQHARDKEQLGFGAVLNVLFEKRWRHDNGKPYHAEIGRTVDRVVLYRLMALAASDKAAGQVRALAWSKLNELRTSLNAQLGNPRFDDNTRAHFRFALLQLQRYEKNPGQIPLPPPLELPPGSPIGGCCFGG